MVVGSGGYDTIEGSGMGYRVSGVGCYMCVRVCGLIMDMHMHI